jgi:hypothetical protein
MQRGGKKGSLASCWFSDSNSELNTPLTSTSETVASLVWKFMTFSKSSHDLASRFKKKRENFFSEADEHA